MKSAPATVAGLAAAKKLPVELLAGLGWRNVSTLTPGERVRYGIRDEVGVVIPYFSDDGTEARCRLRTRLAAKDGSSWLDPKNLPIRAYGEHELADARRLRVLCVTEGESDYVTMRAGGFPALGVPGARNLNVLRPGLFADIQRAYIMQDADPAGARFVVETRRRLSAFGISASYPVVMPAGCKDVNDLYRRDPVAFKATMTTMLCDLRAGPVPPLPTATPSTEPEREPGLVLVCMADVQPEEIAWVWPQRLARGKLTLLIGDPGVGKSTLSLDVIARITRGAEWPDGGRSPEGNAILLACEDSLADTIRPRLDRQQAEARRVFTVQAARAEDGAERHFSIERDLPQLAKVIAEHKPVIVVMDPLSAYFGTGRDSYKDTEVRAVLAPLVMLAERTGTAIFGLMHMTKASQQKALYRALGSIAFPATARIVLAAGKDPAMERCLLMASKQNICAPSATLAYSIGSDCRLEWEADPVHGVNVETVLSGHSQLPEADREDAAAFLRELLSDRSLPQAEVEQAGKGNGFTISQLRRAKRAAGVVSKRSSFRGGVWLWRSTPLSQTLGPQASAEAPTLPKMTLQRESVIFDQSETVTPLESKVFSKVTGVSSSVSCSAESPPSEPVGDWGEV